MQDRAEDAGWMRVALGLARRGLGRVWPNPTVGCVIVREGRVVGRAQTADGGRPHAESLALQQAGEAARGGTVYVSLEPCAHHGLTPPCADGLIAAGISRAVVAMEDPDPRVNGRGIARLREAGLEVTVGCLAEEAAMLNRGFLSRITSGRPMLTLKLAASLDGRIATPSGESRWITGPRARAEVHLMRAQSDAVLVGAGTVRSDNPRLDVRELGITDADPIRVAVTGGLNLARDSHLAETAHDTPLWLIHHAEADEARKQAWTERGAQLIEIPFQDDGQLDLAAMFGELGQRGLTRVLCEGGGRLSAALLEAGLVDEIVLYTAGLALGEEGVAAVGSVRIDSLPLAPQFRLTSVDRIGPDIRSHWRRR